MLPPDDVKAGVEDPAPDRQATKGRANSRGEATRQTLMLTAERLFAERGIAAVSLRDIGIASGQRNHAVVQYHFGDRDNLVREIVAFRAVVTERGRAAMLAEMLSHGRPQPLGLVRVFVLPLAEHVERESHYLAFLSRYITEYGSYQGLAAAVDMIPAGTVAELRSLWGQMFPDFPKEVLEERWMVTMTSAIHTLARYKAMLSSQPEASILIDRQLEDLVRYLTAGLEAPMGPVQPS